MTPGFKVFITVVTAVSAAIILLGMAGCEYTPAPGVVPSPAIAETITIQLDTYGPDANGVVCYHYPYSSANLSCVKVK